MDSDLKNRPDQDSEASPGVYDNKFDPDTPSIPLTQGERDSFDAIRQAEANPDNGNLFNPQGDQNTGNPPDSGAGLAASAAGLTSAGLGAAEALGAGFNPAAGSAGAAAKLLSTFLGSTRRKQATIGGTIASLVVSGAFLGLTVVSGPLKLLHYSHILQGVFTHQSTQDDARVGRLVRWMRSADYGETRIGFISSKILLPNTKAALARDGIKLNTDKLGRLTVVEIDPKKNAKYGRLSNDEAKLAIAKDNGIDLAKIQGRRENTYKFNLKDLKITEQRNVIRTYVADQKLGKLSSAVRFRTLTKYYGISSWLHPVDRLSQELEKKLSERTQKPGAVRDYFRDKTAKLNVKTARVQAIAEEVRGKIGVGGALIGGVLLAGTAICVARDVSNEVPVLNRAYVVIPAMAAGQDAISTGDQTEAGDTQLKLMGILSKNMDGKGPGDSVFDSAGVKALQGKTGGTDIAPSIKQAFTPDGGTEKLNQALSEVHADTICSAAGQTAALLAGITLLALGPGGWIIKGASAAVGGVATYAVISGIQKIVPHLLASDPITGIPHNGVVGGNVDAHGARALSVASSVTMGGVANTDAQHLVLEHQNQRMETIAMAAKPWYQRIFDIKDYRSLSGQIIDSQSSQPGVAVASLAHNLINSGPNVLHLASALLPKASAETKPYDFGFPEYVIGQDILTPAQSDTVEDPYENAKQVAALLNDVATHDDIAKKVDTCFGDTITRDSQNLWTVIGAHDVNPYSKDYTSANCGDTSDQWLKIRYFVYDSSLMDGYGCFNGNVESCTNSGIGTSAVTDAVAIPQSADTGNLYTDSSAVPCAPGTTDAGIETGYHAGAPVKIHLCSVSNLPSGGDESNAGTSYTIATNGLALVNARVSGIFSNMVTAAAGDGVKMKAISSYRTMAHQQYLCRTDRRGNCPGGDTSSVAIPGTSNHQMGLAIDFVNANGTDISPGDKWFTWLSKNASTYGIKNYGAEPWHWSTSAS